MTAGGQMDNNLRENPNNQNRNNKNKNNRQTKMAIVICLVCALFVIIWGRMISKSIDSSINSASIRDISLLALRMLFSIHDFVYFAGHILDIVVSVELRLEAEAVFKICSPY